MEAVRTNTEQFAVRSFDRVWFRAHNVTNEIRVRQGERESLSVQASDDILARLHIEVQAGKLAVALGGSLSDKLRDAFGTSLTRPIIRFNLIVTELRELEAEGFCDLHAASLATDRLSLRINGAGLAQVQSVVTESLVVEMSGAARAAFQEGRVTEQRVTIHAMGAYLAPRLHSRTAHINIHGGGRAIVWATHHLAVTVSGMGTVEYYGRPGIERHLSPMANLTDLGEHSPGHN